jgi:ABC-type polar amino acid transport system ATPase subunit
MALETLGSTRNKKTADAQPAVRISGLRKSFDGRLVLGGIDLDVPVGRIVSIIGQSGGGKTTLMRCVNLLERPDGGSIAIGDETIFADGGVTCRDLAKLRQRVGMVFQRFNLFPHLTAVENVVLAQLHAAAIGSAKRSSGPCGCLRVLASRGEPWRIRSGCLAGSNSASQSRVL